MKDGGECNEQHTQRHLYSPRTHSSMSSSLEDCPSIRVYMPIYSELDFTYRIPALEVSTCDFLLAVLVLFGVLAGCSEEWYRRIRVGSGPSTSCNCDLVRRSRHRWIQHPCRHRCRLQLILRPRRRPLLLLSSAANTPTLPPTPTPTTEATGTLPPVQTAIPTRTPQAFTGYLART